MMTNDNKEIKLEEFETIRKTMVKKCSGCPKILLKEDDPNHCCGWSFTKCVWDCSSDNEEIKELIKKANEYSDNLSCLTDDDIDSITRTLKNNASEETKTLRSILENPVKYYKDIEHEVMEVSMDPHTGKICKTVPYNGEEPRIEDIVLGKANPKSYTEEVVNRIADTYSIRKADAYSVIKLIKELKSNPTMEVYKKLPLGLRQVADGLSENPGDIEDVSRDLIMQFEADLDMDQQFVDIQKSIDSSYQEAASSIGSLQFVNTRKMFEEDLLEAAKEYKDDPDPEKQESYNKLVSVCNSYKSCCYFQIQLKYLMNVQKKTKRKINDTSKFNSVVNHFNEKYRYNSKNIKDIRMIVPILYRKMSVSDELLKKFVILSCLSFEKMTPENINDHIYMFYTVQNLAGMDFIKESDEGYEFASEIANRLIDILEILDDITNGIKRIYFDENDGMYKIKQSINKKRKVV